MKKNLILLSLILVLFSCQRSKRDMLVHNWHAIQLDNPQMTDMIRQQQIFIDTVGRSTTSAANDTLYGVHNLDSMKHDLQNQLDSFKMLQQQTLNNTYFNFRKDGLAVLSFGGYIDTTKWYFDDEGALMLDELKEKGVGTALKMVVVQLNDTSLKLKFVEKDISSIVTFQPEKN